MWGPNDTNELQGSRLGVEVTPAEAGAARLDDGRLPVPDGLGGQLRVVIDRVVPPEVYQDRVVGQGGGLSR